MNATASSPVSARRGRPPPQLFRYFVLERSGHGPQFELWIERDGVLHGWVVPKGVRVMPHERHLAIEVPDHGREHAVLRGAAPSGGSARWDEGPCEIREWTGRRIIVVLRGGRLHGCYALMRAPRIGGRHWLFFSLRRQRRAATVLRDHPSP